MKKNKSFFTRIKFYGVIFISAFVIFLYAYNKVDNFKANMTMADRVISNYPEWYYATLSVGKSSLLIMFFMLAIFLVDLAREIYYIKINKMIAYRFGIVISLLWIIFAAVITKIFQKYKHIDDFMLYGIVPIIVFWGMVWVLSAKK
jgi:hypothetical protein